LTYNDLKCAKPKFNCFKYIGIKFRSAPDSNTEVFFTFSMNCFLVVKSECKDTTKLIPSQEKNEFILK